MTKKLRDLLADGVLVALPLGAAAFLLHRVIGLLRTLLAPATHLMPNGSLLGLAAVDIAAVGVLVLALLTLGVFARSAAGRRTAETIEDVVLSKVPGYLVLKTLGTDLAGVESDLRPALVTFDDNAVLGFIVEESVDAAMFTVFIPSAPGAAAGSVVLMPHGRVQLLDVPTKRAMRAMKQRGLGMQELTGGMTNTQTAK